MRITCSKCGACFDPMFLIESLIATGGQTFRCSCGNERPGGVIRAAIQKTLGQKTVDVARREVRENADAGSTCPCCDQLVKRYDRCMSSTISRWLIAFARASGGEKDAWVHVREPANIMGAASSASRSGDYAKARFWGLIEQKTRRTKADNSSGQWRLTAEGWNFVGLKLKVREKVIVYNNKPIEFSGKDIDIREALGKEFSYEDLFADRKAN